MPTRLNGPIIKLDSPHLKLAKDLITNRACVYVHFAPPCGTCSRARLIQNGDQYMPPPLRNDQYPNGLPWLTKEQQERIDKANELYRITWDLITLCQTHKILWSCENPFMWQTTSFVSLFDTIPCESTQLHHCMYGSSHRKLTRLIHNIPSFHQLCQMCDNKHEHEPWGQKPDGTHGASLELSQHKSFCNLNTKDLCAICPPLPNKNVPCKPCLPPPTFSHAKICHRWWQNLNKSFTRTHRIPCQSTLGYSALPSGGMSRVPKTAKITKSR